MTLTRESARRLAIALVAVLALTLGLLGNQRQAHADFVGDILCQVDQLGDEHDGDSGIFPMFEEDCNSQGGEVIDWCPNIDGNQTQADLPCTRMQCNDGIDNDHDGKIDWQPPVVGDGDPGCEDPTDNDESDDPTPPPPAPACSDGLDNDGDHLIDSSDPGCTDPSDNDETDPTGGGPAACSDLADNDGDGLIDAADPGCTDPSDNDETDPATVPGSTGGSGGSSGGGGGHSSHHSSGGGGQVLGAETNSCSEYLTGFVHWGRANDLEQVSRLQYVLKEFEAAPIEVTGTYDAATLAAVNAFQLKYAPEVLNPWGASQATGYVYLTTRKKINEVYCKGTVQFPLTPTEAEHVVTTRTHAQMAEASGETSVPGISSGVTIPSGSADDNSQGSGDETQNSDNNTSGGWWNNFFNWVFRR